MGIRYVNYTCTICGKKFRWPFDPKLNSYMNSVTHGTPKCPNCGNTIHLKKEACFIATAVNGSYDHPKVFELRKWRDNKLKNSYLGNVFIKIYYKLSPGSV